MRYLSVCAGIEAASVAWHPLGWEAAAFSEIDAFPRAVLAHHYPSVPLHGDFTTIGAEDYGPVDLIVGGTPCQSFSVAGLRKGLDDDRGNLALQFMRLSARIRPTWIVWENVPGVLSSSGGRDFGSILGALGQFGYGWAYRVLDAQYFGVPQRRRRVFVVGCLGSWQRAAAVLFERHSLQGNPAPRREAGKEIAGTFTARAGSGGWSSSADHASAGYMIPVPTAPTVPARRTGRGGLGTDFDCDGGLIARCVTTGEGNRQDAETTTLITAEAFNWQSGGDARGLDPKPTAQLQRGQVPAVMCEPLYNQGIIHGRSNASPQKANTRKILRALREAIGEEALAKWGLGILDSLLPPQVLQQALHGGSLRPAAFSRSWVVYCSLSREKGDSTWLLQSLREAQCEGCPPSGWQPSEQFIGKLRAYLSELSQPGAQAERLMRDLWEADERAGILREALSKIQEMGRSAHGQSEPVFRPSAVRRLTAEECEFLQGFPRGYTLIPWRGKPADCCPDGPRYKALGNSMAVPVMRWIGERIQMVQDLHP